VERQIGPNQFTPEKYNDPRVIDLIGKVTLTGDPTLDKARPAGISEIVTKDGKTFLLRVDHPRGHARNPMTDEEVIAKFKDMAAVRMTETQMNRLIESVFALEKLDDIGKLMKLMVFAKDQS
jgi:2-methylcitrate dehydratase